MDTPQVKSLVGRPDDKTVDIDLTRIRSRLSMQLGWIHSETDARLWIVTAGFRPTLDRRWAGPPQSIARLKQFLDN